MPDELRVCLKIVEQLHAKLIYIETSLSSLCFNFSLYRSLARASVTRRLLGGGKAASRLSNMAAEL
jgi:hypothetical protein